MEHLDVAVVDLDHTLLGPDYQISLENSRAIARLKGRGISIVLASGRSYQQMLWVHRELELDAPMICSNGGLIFLPTAFGGEILYETCLRSAETQGLFTFAMQKHLTFYTYHASGAFVWQQIHWNQFDAGHQGEVPLIFGEPDLERSPAQKVFFSMPQQDADYFYLEVVDLAVGLFVWRGGPETIEVQPANPGKLAAWRHLAGLLAVQPEQFMAFGDGLNDVALLQSAAMGVAMSNAVPECLEAASIISPAGPAETSFARSVSVILDTHCLVG